MAISADDLAFGDLGLQASETHRHQGERGHIAILVVPEVIKLHDVVRVRAPAVGTRNSGLSDRDEVSIALSCDFPVYSSSLLHRRGIARIVSASRCSLILCR
jgi:hypothetical protein